MSLLPKDAKKLELENSTVDFFEYIENGLTCYQFDTSKCAPPEPMVNAMAGLQLLDNENKRLVMINHKPPGGLFPRIEENFDYDLSEIDDGQNVKVVFKYKSDSQPQTDFTQNSCG